jgi:CubicO group peptidase (beta-lactamase class C family)
VNWLIRVLVITGLVAVVSRSAALAQAEREPARRAEPVVATGQTYPGLASFDRLMTRFVAERRVPGAALAVSRNGRLVYARGFGYADLETRQPVQPTSLFRIASVSKPLTSVAILQLVEQGRLKLSDKMVDVLELSPAGPEPDERLREITILELLQHRGGWDRDKSFDPMFRPLRIARKMGVPPPAGHRAIISYMMGFPLDFDPGTRSAYSNFGYCVLGQVVEKVSGEPYESYARKHVLAPLGIHDMRIGHTLPDERAPGEVHYYANRQGLANGVIGPTIGNKVPWPYGGWYLEAMEAHGGWIASAVDLVRFAVAFDHPQHSKLLNAQSIHTMFARPPGAAGFEGGEPKKRYYACGWNVLVVGPGKVNTWHTGLLDGTSTILVRRFDGLSWAVLFNSDADPEAQGGDSLAGRIDGQVHEAADAVTEWSDIDLFPQLLGRPAAPAR